MSYNNNISKKNPQPQSKQYQYQHQQHHQQQQKRRSSGQSSSLMLLASVAVLTGDASAFTQQLQRSVSVPNTPRNSFTALGVTTTTSTSMGPSVEDRRVKKIDDSTLGNYYRQNKNHQDKKIYEDDDDEWELLIYDDQANTREKVARALVKVTGRSETDAFQTMNQAHKTGVATLGTKLRFEVAEAYNEALRTNGILSEIVLVTSSSSGSGIGSSAGGQGSSEGHGGGEWQWNQ